MRHLRTHYDVLQEIVMLQQQEQQQQQQFIGNLRFPPEVVDVLEEIDIDIDIKWENLEEEDEEKEEEFSQDE